MKAVYRCCCGIDVHKKLIVACLKKVGRQEVRELMRYRKSLTEACSRELSRLQKALEGANVKLASVEGDIQGKSARRLLDRLAAGESLGREEVLPLLYKTLQPSRQEKTTMP